jgi:DNA polymerase-3 subunit gamma/tau
MSYQVLARKWRPRNFTEMVGQENILRMLQNALDHDRLHHAYLFTGTRGVGKTTLARILAKCLNCETKITSTPCGTCDTCLAIDSGKFLDLLEIDAASRTKVEDTRELLDNVHYSPTQGRYKIYLIDEVHMLSGHSFNALLKTLEEPPAYVKFLLATTDPKKLPITILSRCLQFNLKRVPIDKITGHLGYICDQEKIAFEKPAIELLAQAADGSLRDSLSLLDQTIAFCNGPITTTNTQQMLGCIEANFIWELLDALVARDGKQLLTAIAKLAEYAPDFNRVLEDLLGALHKISIAQIIPDTEHAIAIKKFAETLSPEDVQLYYQIALIGRRDLPLAPSPESGFEMVMLRMLAFQLNTQSTVTPVQTPAAKPIISAPTKPSPAPAPPAGPAGPAVASAKSASTWPEILPHLNLLGMTYALASHCHLQNLSADRITLILTPSHEAMLNQGLTDRIEAALARYFDREIKLTIKIAKEVTAVTPAKIHQAAQELQQANAVTTIENDEQVKQMLNLFDATLAPGSIKAVAAVSE